MAYRGFCSSLLLPWYSSLDATYTRGGETKIDGDWQDNKQESTLAGALVAVNVFGGFLVTRRMLEMFKKKAPKAKEEVRKP